jgi:hypothetical protein
MSLAKTLMTRASPECLAVFAPNLPVVVPLALLCLAVVFAIPFAAARGKLHIPGYVGLAFLAFVGGLIVGQISGLRSITGTIAGISLSILCFLLFAGAVGSVLALFFYRHPPQA